MNETPYPPLPGIRRLVEEGAGALQRYPDRTSATLVAALAGHLSVEPERILIGPGSAGLCQHLIQSLGPRPEVVYPALSFEGYPLFVMNTGARGVPVPMTPDGLGHDLAAMAAAITDQTRCVLICNPNNPTGAALRREELVAFLDRVPADVPVLIDEAYREFVTDPDVPDALEVARTGGYDNVLVLRTFSKAYGLAALRIGYAVLPARLAPTARLLGMVFFPGGLSQAAATASLAPEIVAEMEARCAGVAEARTLLRARLAELGLPVAPSEANFVWLPLGERAAEFAARARDEAGILVMALPGAGVRITVGSAEANERLCAFVKEKWVAGEG